MTVKELEGYFTSPDENLLKIRKILIKQLEDRILQNNLMYSTKNFPAMPAKEVGKEITNALAFACYLIRDLIDHEGKIYKANLTKG